MKDKKLLALVAALVVAVVSVIGVFVKNGEVSDLKDQLTAMTSQVQDLTAKLTASQADNETAQTALTAAQETVTATQAEVETLTTQASDLTAKLTAAQTDGDAAKADAAAKQADLDAQAAEVAKLQADLAAKTAELETAKADAAAKQADLDAKAAELAAAQDALTAALTQVADLEAKAAAQTEIAAEPVAEPAPEAEAITDAFLMYADAAWANQWWHDGSEPANGLIVKEAKITGEGSYTVGLDFTATPDGSAAGVAFAALGIADGEKLLPNWKIRIDAIRVNGEAVTVGKGYTSSDDGVVTRMNIYNEWVSELPADARSFDGNTADANWIIVNKDDFAAVKTVDVDFTLVKNGIDTAYIMYANGDWSAQYWLDGNDYTGVTPTNATVTGPGDYTVGLAFETPAEGVSFTALGLKKGENLFPGMMLKINDIRINGASVAFEKGYTSSDDSVETRMNVMNEWVGEMPADARSFDGALPTNDETPWIIVDKAAFTGVTSYEIDFSLVPVTDTAYIMFADDAWTVQYWMDGNDYAGVTANNATIEGAGTYTVGLTFDAPTTGTAFAALGIKNGEKTFGGYFIDIKEVKIDGVAVEFGKGYTSSDDKVETRCNLMNEWVGELPKDARRADGDLEGATWMVLSKEALTGITSLEITFEYVYGKPAVDEGPAPLTEEELAALLAADYHAYVAVQSDPSYIFRNDWNDKDYGRDTNPEVFAQLNRTSTEGVDSYGGSFEDATITGSGTFVASMTTGEKGFDADTGFHFWRVTTDIPSRLVTEGHITAECSLKIGDGKTNTGVIVHTEGEYVQFVVVDNYNSIGVDFGWMVPAPNTTSVFTITINGLTD